MKKEQIARDLGGVDAKYIMEGYLDMEGKSNFKRTPRTVKTVLAAAAAVAALALTVLAASPLYRGTGEGTGVTAVEKEDGSRALIRRTEGYKREFFSDGILEQVDYARREREAGEAGEQLRETAPGFTQPESWDEAERLLGIDLLDSDVLDAAPAASYHGADSAAGDGYHMEFVSFGDGDDEILVYREQLVDGINVQLIAAVTLGEEAIKETELPVHGELYEPGEEDADAAPGETRVITMGTGKRYLLEDYGSNTGYRQFTFLESGIEYTVIFKCAPPEELAALGLPTDTPDFDPTAVKVLESLYFDD